MASFSKSSPKSRSAATIGNSAEARSVEAAKTARLRALRLAKEADDREAQKNAAPVTASPTRRARASGSARSRPQAANRE